MVTIAKNGKSGQIFTPGTKVSADGKSYGFYCVEEIAINEEGGFVKEEKRNSILTVENSLGAKLGWSEGMIKAGKIVRTESLTPFFKGQEPVINPTTKAVVTRGGQPLYRQDLYTNNLSLADSLVARDEVAETVASPAGSLAK